MQRARNALVVLQVALTLILLTGAGLLGRSFLRLLAVDPGYRTEGALVLDVVLPYAQNEDVAARQWRFQEELMGRLKRLPGVEEVGGINDFPMGGGYYANGTFLEMSRADQIRSPEDVARLFPEEQARRRSAGFRIASGSYFRAMGIPLIRGRLFDESDTPNAPHVALISESLAKTEWPDQDPIGRFIQFGNMDGDLRGFRIIGIVGDVRELTPEAVPGPLFYGDYRQRPRAAGRFSIIMSGTEAASVAAAAQRIVREMNPQLPVRTRTATDAFAETLAARRFSLLLLAIFAGTALLLATMGIYGVISYMVSQRTREIGIRMVLGANGGRVLRSVLARGVVLTLFGTVLGLGGALAMTRLVQRFLFGVSATDPVAFAGVVALILAATILATFIPAYRAMRLPPTMTLRPD